MLNTIVDRLFSVKSIVTIILTCVFSYMAVQGKIDGKEFITIFTVVISFYFGTQSEKRARENQGHDHEKEDDSNETRGPGSENKGVA